MSHLTEDRSRPNIKIQRSGTEMLDEFRGLLPATDLGVKLKLIWSVKLYQ